MRFVFSLLCEILDDLLNTTKENEKEKETKDDQAEKKSNKLNK